MNRTLLVGRLTATPELRTTPNGIATTRITVAINRLPNANGERIADFINVVVWRRLAENVAKYCTKGSLVAVEGRIQSRSYTAQDGTRRYVTEVVADNINFLSSSNRTSGGVNDYSAPAANQIQDNVMPEQMTDDVPFPTEESSFSTSSIDDDPFKDFGDEVILSDDDLPF